MSQPTMTVPGAPPAAGGTGSAARADAAVPVAHATAGLPQPDSMAPPPVDGAVAAALAFARERLDEAAGENGEPYYEHARGTLEILRTLFADETAQVASVLFPGGDRMNAEEIAARFGQETLELVEGVRQLMRLRGLHHKAPGEGGPLQLETLRRMLLAMAADIRVVLIRLASRLQTLRFHAARRRAPSIDLCQETLEVLAPLANRLGLWQLKWELEDLAFRFVEPETYKRIAGELEDKRRERERFVGEAQARLAAALAAAGVRAELSGRPKHIYSIYSKMRAKGLALDELRDLRGLRVIVEDVRRCYEALSVVHSLWPAIPEEFDDYVTRPKPNGYQSLHTVVVPEDGKPLEVQIRTREMHRHAEYGVASHWSYKERSTALAGAGRHAAGDEARIAWIRQLLAWQGEVGAALGAGGQRLDEGQTRIYTLTPQGRIVELPAGATPVDFAYHVHTTLGHRCRGARVDGAMVPLNTPLQSGQTVEIIAARAGGSGDAPSRDWLNPDLGYVRSARARAKIRQWFNARELEHDVAVGRERVERLLQREGRTALAFEDLATRLGLPTPEAVFAAVGREEIGPRLLEEAVRSAGRPPEPAPAAGEVAPRVLGRGSAAGRQASGESVLVAGVDMLLTPLARCCRPAPPDPIVGFVTRGRGVSVHRRECRTLRRMAERAPERVLETAWAPPPPEGERARAYPVDVVIRANDRPGLLRDISDVFARDRLNVVAVETLSRSQVASMNFTVEVPDVGALQRALVSIGDVRGVFEARRRSA